MIGWTLCSGIGAPEIAAPWVDWRLAAEIEPFPRAVLQHRLGYKIPEDHNQGDPLLWSDMTEVTPELARSRGVPLPEILIAGTPCQAFSIAGLRGGVEDARGNLTLKFVETCHAIVDARPDGKLAVLWENVPGVLSDKGNAFGCFLGGLVGAVDPVFPSDKPADGKSTQFWKWIKAGSVEIENEDGEPTGEFETVEAHHRCRWPSEGMVQGPRARAAWSVLDAQWFGVAQRRRRVFVVIDFGDCIDPGAVLLEPDRLRGDSAPSRETGQSSTAGTIRSTDGGSDVDHAIANHLVSARMTAIGEYADDNTASSLKARDYKDATDLVAHSLRGEGFDASEDGTGRATPLVPVTFDCKGTEVQSDASGGETPLRSMGHNQSHQNAGGHAAIAFQERFRGDDGRGYNRPPPASIDVVGSLETVKPWNVAQEVAGAICKDSFSGGAGGRPEGAAAGHYLAARWAVRRLTPPECARLQGFPDDHCRIPWRGKGMAHCPDGPQYKAFGNSMAVPCVGWITDRMKISMEGMKHAN